MSYKNPKFSVGDLILELARPSSIFFITRVILGGLGNSYLYQGYFLSSYKFTFTEEFLIKEEKSGRIKII
jgi:hypothetical protein